MLDPAKKEYYWKIALQLGLPNAYTAAITDYMRKPAVSIVNHDSDTFKVTVYKHNFSIKKAEVAGKQKEHAASTSHASSYAGHKNIFIKKGDIVIVEDNTGQHFRFDPFHSLSPFPY